MFLGRSHANIHGDVRVDRTHDVLELRKYTK